MRSVPAASWWRGNGGGFPPGRRYFRRSERKPIGVLPHRTRIVGTNGRSVAALSSSDIRAPSDEKATDTIRMRTMPSDRERIARAAGLSGVKFTTIVGASIVREADEHRNTMLARHDSRALLEAPDSPPASGGGSGCGARLRLPDCQWRVMKHRRPLPEASLSRCLCPARPVGLFLRAASPEPAPAGHCCSAGPGSGCDWGTPAPWSPAPRASGPEARWPQTRRRREKTSTRSEWRIAATIHRAAAVSDRHQDGRSDHAWSAGPGPPWQ